MFLLAVAVIMLTISICVRSFAPDLRPILMFACSLALVFASWIVSAVVVVGGLVAVVALALVVGLPHVMVCCMVCVACVI